MCLTQYHPTRKAAREAAKNPLIAKKDIKVYKVLINYKDGNGWLTPYMDFPVELGAHYYQEDTKNDPAFKTQVAKPFSSYCKWQLEIEEGLHSFSTRQKAEIFCDSIYRHTFIGIIPKGSKYYIGTSDDIVSDQLILGKRPLKKKKINYNNYR